MSPPELLRLEGVSAGYGRVPALHAVDLALGHGETLAIIGANGAGKSTLLRAIMGEIPLLGGQIRFAGTRLDGFDIHARARLGIGYAPEGRQLFPMLSVADTLELGAAREPASVRRERRSEMFAIFPKLRPLRDTRCGLLSGGEQQMVAIARALMGRPKLLVLDEPSTGLAPRVIAELYASLSRLLDGGLAVLVAEQNARAALRFARQAAVCEDGRLTLRGPAKTIAEDPRVIAAYIGMRDATIWSAAPESGEA